MSWLSGAGGGGTDVDEREGSTRPLPAGRSTRGRALGAEGLEPAGAPTDPYGDRGQGSWGGSAPADAAGAADPGYRDPGYRDPGYRDPGYGDPGYRDPGYGDPGWSDPGYGDPGWGDPGASGWSDRRWADRGADGGGRGHQRPGDLAPRDPDHAPVDRRLAPRDDRPRRVVPRTVWFFVVLGVLVVATSLAGAIVMGGLANLNPFKNGFITQRTVDRSGPAVLKAVTDLGTLQSASGYYEIVIDVQKSVDNVPSFVAGRRTLFVAAGTVDASVDLRGLPSGAVSVNAPRTAATIRLPKPMLSSPRLDLKRSYVYSQERGLMDRLYDAVNGTPADQQQQLYTLASQRLTQAATANDDLTKRAEANTRTTLQGLLRPLGFTDVTVEFAR